MAPLFDEETFCCDSSFDVSSCYSPKKLEQQQCEDACSSSTPAATETKRLDTNMSKSDDAFLYYSNDEIRIKALKLQQVPETVRSSDIKQRKTRLSYELDALTAMEDMLDEDVDDADDMLDLLSFLGTRGQGTDDIMDTQSLAQ